jgi:hypothetical protein
VPARVERLVQVGAQWIAEVGQDGERLLAHGLQPGHDRRRFSSGVLQGKLEIVEDGQPTRRDPGPLVLALSVGVPRHPLAQVVEVGHRPPVPFLTLGELVTQLRELVADAQGRTVGDRFRRTGRCGHAGRLPLLVGHRRSLRGELGVDHVVVILAARRGAR